MESQYPIPISLELGAGNRLCRIAWHPSAEQPAASSAAAKAQGIICPAPTVGQFAGSAGGPGFGSSGLGIVAGPGQNNWDMSLAKSINIHEAQSLQFRTEFLNTFNHPQFGNPNTNAGSGAFGVINSTAVSPRVIQFALKFSF